MNISVKLHDYYSRLQYDGALNFVHFFWTTLYIPSKLHQFLTIRFFQFLYGQTNKMDGATKNKQIDARRIFFPEANKKLCENSA